MSTKFASQWANVVAGVPSKSSTTPMGTLARLKEILQKQDTIALIHLLRHLSLPESENGPGLDYVHAVINGYGGIDKLFKDAPQVSGLAKSELEELKESISLKLKNRNTQKQSNSSKIQESSSSKPIVAGSKSCGRNNTCSEFQCGQLRKAIDIALELCHKAIFDLNVLPLPPRTRASLVLHFRSESSETRRILKRNISLIMNKLIRTGTDHFICKNTEKCSGLLAPIAYTFQNPAADIYLCPDDFFDDNRSHIERTGIIIHELAHNFGVPRGKSGNLPSSALFEGTDASVIERDVYRYRHEYLTLSMDDALVTADAYRFFVLENEYGPGFHLKGTLELRGGVTLGKNEDQLHLGIRTSGEGEPLLFDVFSPVFGVEFSYDIKKDKVIINGELSTGLQLRPIGDPFVIDVRGGLGFSSLSGQYTANAIWDASVHIHLGLFDVSAFYKEVIPLVGQIKGRRVIGVGFNVFDLVQEAIKD